MYTELELFEQPGFRAYNTGIKTMWYLISLLIGLAWFWVWTMGRPTLGVGDSTHKAYSLDGTKGKRRLTALLLAALCLPCRELFLLCKAPWNQLTVD